MLTEGSGNSSWAGGRWLRAVWGHVILGPWGPKKGVGAQDQVGTDASPRTGFFGAPQAAGGSSKLQEPPGSYVSLSWVTGLLWVC